MRWLCRSRHTQHLATQVASIIRRSNKVAASFSKYFETGRGIGVTFWRCARCRNGLLSHLLVLYRKILVLFNAWIDEATNALKFQVKYSSGTVKNGSVALS